MPTNWIVGEAARLSVAISGNGIATDPAVLRLKTRAPDGTLATAIYGAGPDIVKDAVGSYHADLPLSAPGAWAWRWETDAPLAGAAQGVISVQKSCVV